MNFDDIRPYIDREVPGVIKRLLNDKEFLDAMLKFKNPLIYRFLPKVGNIIIKKVLQNKLGGIKTIADQQNIIQFYIEDVLKKSSSKNTNTGLENTSSKYSHLFISNHRDIVIDPMMLGYLLHSSIFGTVEIAIGDNLLTKQYVSDLMRLNKSFIVKRSLTGRNKLFALKQLSAYINQSIKNKKNVWLAQKEGRAKDSIDKTDPTILKMLHIANKNLTENFTLKNTINQLHIIPVSISYEYDPCARMKAEELYEIQTKGKYIKDKKTDFNSIKRGITGFKGHIHVHFGKEIITTNDDPIEIAKEIDKQIVSNYYLHPSNYIAYEKLRLIDLEIPKIEIPNKSMSKKKIKEFEQLYNKIPRHLQKLFLKSYANPIIHKYQLNL